LEKIIYHKFGLKDEIWNKKKTCIKGSRKKNQKNKKQNQKNKDQIRKNKILWIMIEGWNWKINKTFTIQLIPKN
jgi:hypothetical protein